MDRYRLGIDIFSAVGLDLEGFEDLTTQACAQFNAAADGFEKRCGVTFRTYAGAQSLEATFFPLKLPWAYIHTHEGDNDGLVSVKSARWKDEYFREQIVADHLNEIGWWDPDDVWEGEPPEQLEARIQQFYLKIAKELPGPS